MENTKFIPGFRFHPTDVELVKYFLKRKVMGKKFPFDVIAEVDIYKFAPWDLPDKSLLRTGDLEWYFFCPRGKKYANGARLNRATETGYWKTTGTDRSIQHNNRVVGMIKTLVFHTGKAPQGERTDWVMHEFRLLQDKELTDHGIQQDSYVICKVFQKEGPGPRNGAQYGKPFNEKDWYEEDAPSATPIPVQPSTSCVSGLIPSPWLTHPSAQSSFKEDDTMALNENNTEEVDNPVPDNNAEAPCSDSGDVFIDLGDLDVLFWDQPDFLELIDLEAPLWKRQ